MLLKVGDRNPLVAFFQFVLKENNYYLGSIDGIFGNQTKEAVISFQKSLNLSQSGIIDDELVKELLPYITVPTSIPYTYEITNIVIQAILYKYNFLQMQNISDRCYLQDPHYSLRS